MALREIHLFAGAGGGILGSLLLGHDPVCAVEANPYRRRVLLARIRDGYLPPFPVWDDVRTFDGKPWRGHCDVVSGGFPCTGFSSAGSRSGFADSGSALWGHMARIVGEVRPRFVWVENSPGIVKLGLSRLLCDLTELGYSARWGRLGARHAGSIHRRDRFWLLASHPDIHCEPTVSVDATVAGVSRVGGTGWERWRHSEPGLGGVADGVAHRVDRLKAIGAGQVPDVVRLAWRTLID